MAFACVMCRSAESFCALACATRASAWVNPASAVAHAFLRLSKSDFEIRPSLYRLWARSQSSLLRSWSACARSRSACEVLSAASAATASVCAACNEASFALTSADDCTFSSCASICPFLT